MAVLLFERARTNFATWRPQIHGLRATIRRHIGEYALSDNGPAVCREPIRSDLTAVVVLTALWFIPIAVIGVHGQFPLNDDWAYARAARSLVETDLVERVAWTWVPMISIAAIGALFSSTFGFSFETLRWSGVSMGWLGMVGSYVIFRQVGARPFECILATVLLAFNPLYLVLSYSYMTEVPFTAMCTWSLVFLLSGCKSGRWPDFLAGALLALAATLGRQAGMAIPMALAAALLASSPTRVRSWAVSITCALIVGVGYRAAMKFFYGPLDSSTLVTLQHVAKLPENYPVYHTVRNGLSLFPYLGWFLAPIVLLSSPFKRSHSWVLMLCGAGFVAVSFFGIRIFELSMPPGTNLIYDTGLGPPTLAGNEILPTAPPGVWWIIIAIGNFLGFVALVEVAIGLLPRILSLRKRAEWLLLLAFPVIYLLPHLARSPCFDRYLLPSLAPFIAITLVIPRRFSPPQRSSVLASAAILLLLAGYGIAGTRDYLESHRARWNLLTNLMESGVEPRQIDGGFEFNGWYSFERRDLPDGTPRWGFFHGDEYRLAFDPFIEGYQPIATRTVRRWLPPGSQEQITLFQRKPGDQEAEPGGKPPQGTQDHHQPGE